MGEDVSTVQRVIRVAKYRGLGFYVNAVKGWLMSWQGVVRSLTTFRYETFQDMMSFRVPGLSMR